MRIRVLQHVPHEGPAAIAEWAHARGHEMAITHVDIDGMTLPDESYDMLVILGGPMGVADDEAYPWLTAEKRFVAQAVERAREGSSAVVGVCLGAQLIAHVSGASVTRNPEPEIGWYPVRRTPEAAEAVALAGVPEELTVLHWHGDMFGIPRGAIRCLSSEACPNQAFELADGRIVGLQFHLEQTSASLPEMVAGNADELAMCGAYIQNRRQLLRADAPHVECASTLYTVLDAIGRSVR